MTAHTTNPVPLTLIGAGTVTLREGGKLADIAPTCSSCWDKAAGGHDGRGAVLT